MDVIDIANKQASLILKAHIEEQRNNATMKKRTGYCIYCGDKCKDKKALFCSSECRDDYEKEQKRLKHQFI